MLKRTASLLVFLFAILLFTVFWRGFEYYNSMQLFIAGGKPHLLLQNRGTTGEGGNDQLFSVYVPRDKRLEDWERVIPDFYGPVYGVFQSPLHGRKPGEIQPSITEIPTENPAPAPPVATQPARPNYLGVSHHRRATLFNLSEKSPANDFKSLPLSFDWIAETAVEIDGTTYLFGSDIPLETAEVRPLKVAQFDGSEIRELPALGPRIVPLQFSLQAVVVDGRACVIWRDAENDSSLGGIEGDRFVTTGPLKMATFDPASSTFLKEVVQVDGLPRGNTVTWSDGDKIKVLVQTRSSSDQASKTRGAMEIWEFSGWKDEKVVAAKLSETIASNAKGAFFPYIAAEHVEWDGQEFILRSNWQHFELWRKAPGEAWTLAIKNPRGLPMYDLESKFFAALALCIGLTVFGGGLAYKRRQQAWAVVKQLQPADIYATVGARMGAYVLDLILVFLMTFGVARLLGQINIMPYEMLTSLNFTHSLHRPFLVVYILYFTLSEWLTSRTVGKYSMGLCVVAENNSKISLWSAFLRNAVGLYERLPFILIVPMIMMFIGPRRQRMGDLFARTFVVYKGAWDLLLTQSRDAQAAALLKQQAEKQA